MRASSGVDSEREATAGVFFPKNLKTGRKYGYVFRTGTGDTSESLYHVVASRRTRDCGSINRPECVGLNEAGGENKSLIPTKTKAPECRRWRQGRASRSC